MSRKKWVEIFPYGVTLAADQSRPIMLFKDKDHTRVLPVWLSPLDAGITIHQNSSNVGTSPYNLTWKILRPLDIFLRECYFTEVKGHNQYVELNFEGHPKLKTLKSRAEEAVSFCLSVDTKFYCRPDYFDECRVLEAEINATAIEMAKRPGVNYNKSPYMN